MRRAAALALACCLLTGCAVRAARLPAEASIPHLDNAPTPTPQPGGDGGGEGGFWLPDEPAAIPDEEALLYGSVGLPSEPTILVSVYLDEAGGRTWDEKGMAETRAHLAVAAEWLQEQMAAYGTEFTLYYDDGGGALSVRQTVEHIFNGDDEGEEFHLELDELCDALDTDDLRQAYGTDRVGFLFFLPAPGVSYTLPHYMEDGGWYYHEYCMLYRYDAYSDEGTPESPAVYAHEILHLYGAPDLYEDSADYYVSDELVEYVYAQWPDAIMQYTYNDDGGIDYDRIGKILCPLTAYRLGLCDTFEGIERFPEVTELPPGAFADGPSAASATLAGAGGIAV